MDEILEYERLVASVVMKFKNFCEYEDLMQVGMMGLAKAYNNYNQNQNTKFSSYAYKYILGEILNYIEKSKLINISKDTSKLYREIVKTKELMQNRLNREPSITEIALFLNKEESEISEAINANYFVKSLDYIISDESEKDLSLYDVMGYEENGLNLEYMNLMNELERLPEEERNIIYYRYFDDYTQSEVGRLMNTSQVDICRSEKKILKKLRDKVAA